jgi:hypothetical protein
MIFPSMGRDKGKMRDCSPFTKAQNERDTLLYTPQDKIRWKTSLLKPELKRFTLDRALPSLFP